MKKAVACVAVFMSGCMLFGAKPDPKVAALQAELHNPCMLKSEQYPKVEGGYKTIYEVPGRTNQMTAAFDSDRQGEEACREFLTEKFGALPLREALAEFLKNRRGIDEVEAVGYIESRTKVDVYGKVAFAAPHDLDRVVAALGETLRGSRKLGVLPLPRNVARR